LLAPRAQKTSLNTGKALSASSRSELLLFRPRPNQITCSLTSPQLKRTTEPVALRIMAPFQTTAITRVVSTGCQCPGHPSHKPRIINRLPQSLGGRGGVSPHVGVRSGTQLHLHCRKPCKINSCT
jgi:hypothetical protein